MKLRGGLALLCATCAIVSPAWAGDVPLYQPAGAWVVPAALPEVKSVNTAPAMLLLDLQQRIEKDTFHSYVDSATRMASAEMLSHAATLAVPWAPDKGDLIIHELSILRGAERIDLLAQGQKFTVLRREETLESLELTGILTATLAVEGLQLNDILRFRATVTDKDRALAGRVQSNMPLMASPAKIGSANLRLSWPVSDTSPRWHVLAKNLQATPVRKGDYEELSIKLPIAKQDEIPPDAPARYNRPPLIEVSTFADWADVSKVMAPLYRTDRAIAPNSPLAAQVAAIEKAEATPLGRTQRALELVQDKVRYLAVGMDGGNYIPQTPARTWEMRYGDCKAKTLLLLALLHAMKIEAEPVTAHLGMGDFVVDRLPSAQAFNHVLVRAVVDGKTLWLDGTGAGSRLADIHDTPPLGHVLPIRMDGADLIKVETHANARPSIDVSIEADESSSLDLPSAFSATAVLRGSMAGALMLADAQLDDEQQRDAVHGFFQTTLGEAQITDASITPDPAAGQVTLKARGIIGPQWKDVDLRRKRDLSALWADMSFAPDRGRAAWKTIPVAVPPPTSARYRLSLRLPEGGRGYTLEGAGDLDAQAAGYRLTRTTRLADGVVTFDERMDSLGGEIAPDRIAAEREKAAIVTTRLPRIVAPLDARRRWDVTPNDKATTQIGAVDALLAKVIKDDPEEATSLLSRYSFRNGIGDRAGAREDLGRAIELEPTVDLYLRRSGLNYELGDLDAGIADAEAARALDPSAPGAIHQLAQLVAEKGDLPAATALIDEQIGIGGDARDRFRQSKAVVVGEYGGDVAASIALFDELIAERPDSASLFNGRCWIKGLGAVMLESAIKDCTTATELSSGSAAILDSRALVWYRLGRYDEALRDLDAALRQAPGQAASRFLRAIVLTKLGRAGEAKRELEVSRRLGPSAERTYARFGIRP